MQGSVPCNARTLTSPITFQGGKGSPPFTPVNVRLLGEAGVTHSAFVVFKCCFKCSFLCFLILVLQHPQWHLQQPQQACIWRIRVPDTLYPLYPIPHTLYTADPPSPCPLYVISYTLNRKDMVCSMFWTLPCKEREPQPWAKHQVPMDVQGSAIY